MKRSKVIPIIVLVCIYTSVLYGQNQTVRIYGSAPEYKNYALVFEHFQNFINQEQSELFTLEINEQGTFDYTFPLNVTTYAFADIGQFRAYIYLVPGKEYHIKLPPFRPLSQAQKLNPFFQPEPIVIGILNESSEGLNARIRDFDHVLGNKLRNYAVKLITTKNKNLAKAIIDSLETEFPNGSEFFRMHKHFSYTSLALLASRNKEQDVVQKYFSQFPVFYNLPAYWISFKEVFAGYCHTFFNKYHFQTTITYGSIVDSIQSSPFFQRPDLAEMLALWIIYESYHENLLAPKTALQLFQQAANKTNIEPIKDIASTLYNRMKILMVGESAPNFKLPDFSGTEKSLNDFKGKFVYLNFIHTDNYACRKDMKLLKKIHDKFYRDLEIVSIVIDENYEKASQFLNENKNNFNWNFLYIAMQGEIINNYNVQAVPLYYLINPDGKFVLVPAPAPEENFQEVFISEYNKWRRLQLRKPSSSQKTLFGK
ncbi:TlpA family protein disulfide reductase [Thermophagus xiamenensis]|uniref:Peroxiredoxin n=1 Tax=Thermophagus xiamenensis TaxID=385682 RepID=A0A1I1UT15_9BACT|nr:TlpA disulfide reductase family protein [Thermophagus xiamenensis]SFD71130.1 Peroxiredoxin [Thermophagus xiamenensis]